MSLEDEIKKIQGKPIPPLERAISQGIVEPLFRALNWPVDEPYHVYPEYNVRNMRVDYALCVKPSKPDIFVEVKQPGGIDIDAVRQLLNYAFHEGVQVAVATDGYEWRFYWPSGKGDFESRKFCEVSLRNLDITVAVIRLESYLSFNKVAAKEAIKNAKRAYEELCEGREAAEQIPTACGMLLKEHQDAIVRAVAGKVQDICGCEPSEENIIKHLMSLKSIVAPDKSIVAPGNGGKGKAPIKKHKKGKRKNIKVTFRDGEVICERLAKDTFIETLRKIGFAEAARAEIERSGHPIISREQPQERGQDWEDVGEGWFVRTLSSTSAKVDDLQEIDGYLNLGLEIKQIE